MGFTRNLAGLIAGVCVLGFSLDASAQPWEVDEDLSGVTSVLYDGSPPLLEINTNFDFTNFVGQDLIGVDFAITPAAGFSYGVGEFEAIVFDLVVDTAADQSPWVPASSPSQIGETVTLDPGGQVLSFRFPSDPIGAFESASFRFQIERPSVDTLFDVTVSPVIPEPASLGLVALGIAGFVVRRNRR
ncbi:MAG: PEP-CTERM sorting domain-containing protein [Planctomycetota bacterium]